MGKTLAGPFGEKMYNRLEFEVAGVLKNSNIDYEKRFITGKGNGYFSCDFFMNFLKDVFLLKQLIGINLKKRVID